MTKTKKAYYTLLVKDPSGYWAPQYGSYVYGDCLSERDDYNSHGTKMTDMKIISSDEDQKSIDLRVKEMNAPCSTRS